MEEEIRINLPIIDKNLYNRYLLEYVDVIKNNINLMTLIHKTEEPIYLNWDEIKYKSWIPNQYTKKEFWTLIRVHRDINYRNTPIRSQDNNNFKYYELHNFNNGNLFLDNKPIININEYLKSSILEESISSSQLEGANTTKRKAKKMILEEQKPTNNSEQMILNNYNAMQRIQIDYKSEELSIEMIKELHLILTKNDNNIENNKKGIFRTNKDEIVVGSNI